MTDEIEMHQSQKNFKTLDDFVSQKIKRAERLKKQTVYKHLLFVFWFVCVFVCFCLLLAVVMGHLLVFFFIAQFRNM